MSIHTMLQRGNAATAASEGGMHAREGRLWLRESKMLMGVKHFDDGRLSMSMDVSRRTL